MGNSKVIFGNETLIDLTGDTVNANNLLSGANAHDRSGTQVVGNVTVPSVLDDLTDVDITSATSGQALVYDGSKWVNDTVSGVPTGGTTNQVLAKNSNTDGDTKWMDVPSVAEVDAIRDNGAVNVLPNTAASQVLNGITFTVNSNGSVQVSTGVGGASAQTVFVLYEGPQNWNGYYLNGCPSGGSGSTYDLAVTDLVTYGENSCRPDATTLNNITNGNNVRVFIRVRQGVVITTPITFEPMVYKFGLGANVPYQPYAMTNVELTEATSEVYAYYDSHTVAITVDTTKTVAQNMALLQTAALNYLATFKNSKHTMTQLLVEGYYLPSAYWNKLPLSSARNSFERLYTDNTKMTMCQTDLNGASSYLRKTEIGAGTYTRTDMSSNMATAGTYQVIIDIYRKVSG